MLKFHIIQFVVVYQNSRSSRVRFIPSPRVLRYSSTTPPCPCTMPLGTPVVPDEYSTQSGWSNGTGSGASRAAPSAPSAPSIPSSSAGSAASAHSVTATAYGAGGSPRCRRCSTSVSVGSRALSRTASSRRSCARPAKW